MLLSRCGWVGPGKALLFIYLIYDAFVGCDHRLASIWTMVWDVSLKTTLLPLLLYLNLVCNNFNHTLMYGNVLWTLCNMWHVCWIMYDLGCMLVMNRDPSRYSMDYQVYMGSSMIVRLFCRLPLYLCSYKLDGSIIVGIRARFNIIAICVFKTKFFVLQKTNFWQFIAIYICVCVQI